GQAFDRLGAFLLDLHPNALDEIPRMFVLARSSHEVAFCLERLRIGQRGSEIDLSGGSANGLLASRSLCHRGGVLLRKTPRERSEKSNKDQASRYYFNHGLGFFELKERCLNHLAAFFCCGLDSRMVCFLLDFADNTTSVGVMATILYVSPPIESSSLTF